MGTDHRSTDCVHTDWVAGPSAAARELWVRSVPLRWRQLDPGHWDQLLPDWRQRVQRWLQGPPKNLLVVGPPQSGKTSLACSIGYECICLDADQTALYVSAPTLSLARDWGVGHGASILILDDLDHLGGFPNVNDWDQTKAFELLNYRYNQSRRTIVILDETSARDDLAVMRMAYGDAVATRICAGAITIRIAAAD
jgi:DNA replication protein DnaC